MQSCSECTNPIHPERLRAIPNAETCSTVCSKKRSTKRRAGAARRRHEETGYKSARESIRRKRAARKASAQG